MKRNIWIQIILIEPLQEVERSDLSNDRNVVYMCVFGGDSDKVGNISNPKILLTNLKFVVSTGNFNSEFLIKDYINKLNNEIEILFEMNNLVIWAKTFSNWLEQRQGKKGKVSSEQNLLGC